MEASHLNTSQSRSLDRKTIEKNRRMQMKALYLELISLLPNHTSRETLTLPDQLDEAAKYIKKLQVNVEKMRERKKKLIATSSFERLNSAGSSSSVDVSVSRRLPKLEIQEFGSIFHIILVTSLEHKFVFYEIIRILTEELGAEITHAGYSMVDDSLFHTLHCKGFPLPSSNCNTIFSAMVVGAFEVVAVPFNSDGWGPPDASDVSSSASSTSVAAANLLPNIPFTSFSRSDKLGRVADWTRNLSNPARPPTGSKSDPSALFDFSAFAIDEGLGLTSSGNPDEDAAFRLVDGKPPPRPKFGPKWRFNPHHNRNQLPQRRDEEVEAKKRDAEKERARRDRLYNLNRNNIHHQRREAAAFKSSVDIQPEWNMLEQIPFSTFSKLSATVQDPEDLLLCGGLDYYNRVYDRITPKNERRLERFKNRNFFKVTTSDDPVIRRLAKEDKATVFATDAILAALMCAPRSVYSWDIVIQRVGNKLFFDKRDGSQLDLLSVHETSQEPLPEAKDDINSVYSLGVEAAYINQNFSQQVLVRDGKKETFDEANPFANEGEEIASVAYRYRRWKLDENMHLVARCELQSVADLNNQRSFLTLNALNEFDPKYSGVDWRQKLETQRGAVLATELKNNGNKLAKWTAQALLANADMMKIGFVSRVHPRDHFNHVILSVLGYKPKDFAGQINLNTNNMWGIVRSIVDLCMKLSEGKYVLVKDPSKPQVRIYEVPPDAFENDYVEEPLPEDEQVQPPEENTEGAEASAAATNETEDKKAVETQA